MTEKVATVRNLPVAPGSPLCGNTKLRETTGIPADHLLFLYQGTIGPGRGTQTLIEAFQGVSPDKHIVFMGYGPGETLVRDAAARHVNIHYKAAVLPADILTHTIGADVGLCLIEDTCLSYRYCLPNKLFEYMMVGLPVIVSDLPELARAVGTKGWVVSATAAKVRKLVASIHRATVDEHRARVADSAIPAWDNEAPILLKIYGDLLEGENRSLLRQNL